ncbi:MAG: alpha/beta fold hydrolase, partial [Alphaproteobacteria bacterium]
SLSWSLIYARLQQHFGKLVDADLFAPNGAAMTIETLTQALSTRMLNAPPDKQPPQENAPLVANQVWRRLAASEQNSVQLVNTAKLARGEFTTRRGQTIEYFESGNDNGPALIILTALAFTKSIWENQIAAFAPGYRLIFPHLPGHAGSIYSGKGFSFEDLADDLAELMDKLNIGQAHLAGWCMAGNIAQLFALRHPQRLKSLALICTTPTDARMRGLGQQELEDYSASPLLTYQMEFNNIYHENFLAPEVQNSLSIIQQSYVPVDQQALLSFISSLFQFDTRDHLHEIQAPTLVVAGKRDIAFPVEQVSLLKDGIKNARFEVIENGGHLPFLNQSRLFNETLLSFLAGIPPEEQRIPASWATQDNRAC